MGGFFSDNDDDAVVQGSSGSVVVDSSTGGTTNETSPGGFFADEGASASQGRSANNSANDADTAAKNARGWAVGDTDAPLDGWSATDNAKYHAEQAEESADSAITSASNASESAEDAEESATDAANSASAAATSESNASSSATSAGTSATNAANSAASADSDATLAVDSAAAAATSETNAANSAASASTSAISADSDATVAVNAKNDAETARDAAETAETNAAASATSAATSETNAANSATMADSEADQSEAWAVGQIDDVDVPITAVQHNNNAKYWAERAESHSERNEGYEQEIEVTSTSTTFTLDSSNLMGDPIIFLNGVALNADDWSISGSTLTLTNSVYSGSVLLVRSGTQLTEATENVFAIKVMTSSDIPDGSDANVSIDTDDLIYKPTDDAVLAVLKTTGTSNIRWEQDNVVHTLEVGDVHDTDGTGGRVRISLRADPAISDGGNASRLDLTTVTTYDLIENGDALTFAGNTWNVETENYSGDSDGVGTLANDTDAKITFTQLSEGVNTISTGDVIQKVQNDTQELTTAGTYRWSGTRWELVGPHRFVKINGSDSVSQSSASGTDAIGLGVGASAGGTRGTAVGHDASAGGTDSLALGENANASGTETIAIGKDTVANSNDAIAIGTSSTASDEDTIALGTNSTASGEHSIAIGRFTDSTGNGSIAIGSSIGDELSDTDSADASGNTSIAIGVNSNAGHVNSIALGHNATTTADSEMVIDSVNSIKTPGFTGGSSQYIAVDSSGTWTTETVSSDGTTVVANPGGSPATDLDTITIGSTDYNIPSSSGLTSVSTDSTLTGTGTSSDPLVVANPFTDSDETKLDGIEASADVTDSTNVESSITAGDGISKSSDNSATISVDTDEVFLFADSDFIGLSTSPFTPAVAQIQTITVLSTATSHAPLTINVYDTNGIVDASIILANAFVTANDIATEIKAGLDSDVSFVTATVSDNVVTMTWNTAGAVDNDTTITGDADSILTVATTTAGVDAINTASSKLTLGSGLEVVNDTEISIASTDNAFNSRFVKVEGSNTDTAADGSGADAIAIGIGAVADSDSSIAIGHFADAAGLESVAIGPAFVKLSSFNTAATGDYSIALGNQAQASGFRAYALGGSTEADGLESVAVGFNSHVDTDRAVGLGPQTSATGELAVAIGAFTDANGFASIAIGGADTDDDSADVTMAADYGIALGYNTQAAHTNSVAIGRNAETTDSDQMMLGSNTITRYVIGDADYTPDTDRSIADKGYVDSQVSLSTLGITATAAELNYNDITTLGTSEASKVVTADSNGVVGFGAAVVENSSSLSSSSNATTINVRLGSYFTQTLSENTTYSFTNPASSGNASSFTLVVTQDATGGRTITWPSSVQWHEGTAPTLTTTANTKNVLSFFTVDAGNSWIGGVVALEVS